MGFGLIAGPPVEDGFGLLEGLKVVMMTGGGISPYSIKKVLKSYRVG